MRSILLRHNRRYSLWELPDMYKLLFQAALGTGHAVASAEAAHNWLLQELASLASGPEEPLVDPISPDGHIVRVHLRPFAALHLDSSDLLQAFVRTAAEILPDKHRLEQSVFSFLQLARDGLIRCSEDQAKYYLEEMRSNGFPPVHHSQEYKRSYQPAYRVVARHFLPDVILLAA